MLILLSHALQTIPSDVIEVVTEYRKDRCRVEAMCVARHLEAAVPSTLERLNDLYIEAPGRCKFLGLICSQTPIGRFSRTTVQSLKQGGLRPVVISSDGEAQTIAIVRNCDVLSDYKTLVIITVESKALTWRKGEGGMEEIDASTVLANLDAYEFLVSGPAFHKLTKMPFKKWSVMDFLLPHCRGFCRMKPMGSRGRRELVRVCTSISVLSLLQFTKLFASLRCLIDALRHCMLELELHAPLPFVRLTVAIQHGILMWRLAAQL